MKRFLEWLKGWFPPLPPSSQLLDELNQRYRIEDEIGRRADKAARGKRK